MRAAERCGWDSRAPSMACFVSRQPQRTKTTERRTEVLDAHARRGALQLGRPRSVEAERSVNVPSMAYGQIFFAPGWAES